MFTTYGTAKYYEYELAKAKFKESAIKKHVKDCLAKKADPSDAEVLYCYAELINEAEEETRKLQVLYDYSKSKENTEKKAE